ncbi:MAG: VCBS repeat-containing protein, partial [Pirellulaceae bacterium]|nr:VCBS repeat-containing protein [Pirellulaceae bacterium]
MWKPLLEQLEDRRLLTGLVFQNQAFLGGSGNQAGTGLAAVAGDLYVSGTTDINGEDGLVARFSPGLSVAWSKSWPTLANGDNFFDVAVSGEGVYTFGSSYQRTTDTAGGKENKGITVKFPLSGPPGGGFDGAVWDRQTPGAPGAFSFGGGEVLWGGTVATESAQTFVYATGAGQSGFSNGGRFHLTKLDTASNILWSRNDGSEQVGNSYSSGADVAAINGFVYVAGRNDDDSAQRPYLRKYDAGGNFQWSRKSSSSFAFTGEYTALAGADNAIYTVGYRSSGVGGSDDFLIEKWDEAGNRIWSRQYDRGSSSDRLFGVEASGGRLFAVGSTNGMSAGGTDAIILELDPNNGDLLSSTLYGSTQDDAAQGVVLSGADLYIAGATRSFAVGGNAIGQNDVFLARYSLPATTISLSGMNLLIQDTGDPTNDTLTLSGNGASLTIHDPNNFLTTSIPGATGNLTHTVTVPLGGITGIVVDALGGDDSLSVDFSIGNPIPSNGISFLGGSGGSDSLIVTGGTTTTVTHTFTNASDGSVTLAGALAGTITYTGLEPVTDNLSATDRVFTFTGGAETITVTDGVAADNMTMIDSTLGESVYFTNPTGSLTINAGTGNDTVTITSVDAGYNAALTIHGDDDNDTVNLNADLTLASGNSLTVTAETINVGATADLTTSGSGNISLTAVRNIVVGANAEITATGSGTIDLSANQQMTPTSGNFIGVDVAGAVSGGTGNVTVLGRGGEDPAGNNFGVRVTGSSAQITSSGGAVAVTGTGGGTASSGANFGVLVADGAVITSTGIGVGATVTVVGQGGNTGGTGGNLNVGVQVTGSGSQITSSGGMVSVTGTGGGAGTGGFHYGVHVVGGGSITSAGTGTAATVTVVGQGGNLSGTGGSNNGVQVENLGSQITSSGGAVSVTGTGGGAGTAGFNYGVGVSASGLITSAGTGSGATVNVVGQGGNAAGTGSGNYGVLVLDSGSQITSSGGAVLITGTGTSNSAAVRLDNSGSIASGSNAAITITADSVTLLPGTSVNSGPGTTTFVQRTAGTLINLAGGDVLTSNPLTLGLTDAELDLVTAGTVQIGDAGSGTITVTGAITHSNNLSLTTGAGITVSQPVTLAMDKNLTALSLGTSAGINLSSIAADLTTTGNGNLSLTAIRNIALSGSGASIQAENGDVTLLANSSGTTGGDFDGIRLFGTGTIVTTTGSGSVSLTGTGGSGPTANNHGVEITSGATVSSGGMGTVTVHGTGGSGDGGGNHGVSVSSTNTLITSGGGHIFVTGIGGSGTSNSNRGVYVASEAKIMGGGATGNVTIHGTGGAGAGSGNDGVQLFSSIGQVQINSGGGNVQVAGLGGSNTAGGTSDGVDLDSGSLVTAGGSGSVTVNGTGGAGTGNSNKGVVVRNMGMVSSSGGLVTVTGQGGGSGASVINDGVQVSGTITSGAGGNVIVTGTGGNNNSYGVFLFGTVTSDTTGTVSVTGTGGGSAPAVRVDGQLTSGGGDVTVTGAAGVETANGGDITTAANGGSITVIANSIDIPSGTTVDAGAGTVNLRQSTNAFAINLGAGDTGSQLGLIDSELDRVTAGTLNIGDSNSGTITVSAAISHGNNLVLTTGAGIAFNQSVTMAADKSLAASAVSTISLPNSTSDLAASGVGSISLTTERNLALSSGSSVTTVDGGIALSANQQMTPTAGSFVGVDINGGLVQSTSSGTITVLGRGGDLASGGQIGVRVLGGGDILGGIGGVVTVTGHGGALTATAGGDSHGVVITGSGSTIASSGANVSVTGTGGGNGVGGVSQRDSGVYLLSGGAISAGGSGTVTVLGHGGGIANYSGFDHHGVIVDGTSSTITSNAGNVSVTGFGGGNQTGGVSERDSGVRVVNGGTISAGSTGAVIVQGQGGGITNNAGFDHYGILVSGSGSTITSGGGNVSLTGTGGGGDRSSRDWGVAVFNGGRVTAGSSGTVTVTGQGGTTQAYMGSFPGPENYGVIVSGSSSEITSSGGNVVVTGTGGGFAGHSNHGVFVTASGQITSGGGNVSVTGTPGTGTDTFAVRLADLASVTTATNGGTITIVGDRMDFSSGSPTINAGILTATLKQQISGTQINLGAADTVSALGLTDTELDNVTAGTLQIGDSSSGAVSVSGVISQTGKVTSITTPLTTTVLATGDLGITGAVNSPLVVNSGGDLRPGTSPGVIDSGDVTFDSGSHFHVELNGILVGTDYDQLDVTGTVTLNDGNLNVTLGYAPVNGDSFTIINNDGADAILGLATFKVGGITIPDGGTFMVGGTTFVIDYTSGSDSNDVTLTVQNPVNSLTASIVGGDLVIEDIDGTGKDNILTLSRVGANLVISDANEQFATAIPGAVLSNGNKTVSVPASALGMAGQIIILSQGGGDSLTIDVSTDLGVDVDYQGGAGMSDSLTLAADTVTSVTHAFISDSAGSVTIEDGGARVIMYSGLEPIIDNLLATDRVFMFTGGAETITVTDGTASDGKTMIDSTLGESVYFTNPTGSMTINSGTGDDLVAITSVDAGYGAALTINGDGDNDTVNLDADLSLAAGNSLSVTAETINVGTGADLVSSGAGVITFTADDVAIAGGSTLVSTGTVTIQPQTASRPIDLGTETAGSLSLTDAELDRITAGTVQIGDGTSGTLTVSMPLTLNTNLSLTTGATIVLAANISTDAALLAGSLALNGPVVIAEGVSVSIDTDSSSSDGGVTFASTINGTAGGGSEHLNIIGGTGGNVSVTGAIGGVEPLGTLTVTSANNVTLSGNTTTTGNVGITAQNSVSVQGIDAGGGTITIAANQDNSATQGFSQGVGTTIQTTNSTAGAVSIVVNTSASNLGTGTAALRNISAGGGAAAQITVNTHGGNMTQGTGTVLSAPAGTVSLTGSSTTLANSMGTAGAPIRTTAAFVTFDARGVATHDNAFITETDGATFSGTGSVSSGSNITLGNLSGTLIVGGSGITTTNDISFGSGGVTLSSADGIQIDAPIVTPNDGVGVAINANTMGTDAAGFVMNAGGSIHNQSSTTLVINVNNAAGGTGGAELRNVWVGNGGNLTVSTAAGGNTTGGSITRIAGTSLISGVGNIVLSTGASTGGIGTPGLPIFTVTGGLRVLTGSGGAFISESDALGVREFVVTGGGDATITAGGTLSLVNDFGNTTLGTGTLTLNPGGTGVNITGGSTNVAGGAIDVNGHLTLTGGTLLAPTSGSFTVSGDWIRTGTTFTHGGGTVTFDGASGTQTVNSGGASFGGISHGSASTVQLVTSNLTTTGTLTNSAGTLDINGRLVTANTLVLAGGTISDTNGTPGQITSSNAFDLRDGTVSARMAGSTGANKTTGGTVTLSGANTYTGTTTVSDGTLIVNGSITSSVTNNSPGTLAGSGTITGNVSGTGTFAPGTSPGVMTINGNFAPTGTVEFEVNPPATTAGMHYDQYDVNGLLDLSGATLSFSGAAGVVAMNQLVTLVDNDPADVTGPATNFADGATVVINGNTYKIVYNGGDGNDVVLVETAMAPTVAYVDDSFTQMFGQSVADADLGTAGNQPATFGINAFKTITAALASVASGSTIVVNGGSYAETVSLANGHTLRIGGPDVAQNVTIDDLAGVAGTTITLSGTSSLALGDADNRTLASLIQGGGSLTKLGGGTLELSGANTYTGVTTIQNGFIDATNPASLGASGAGQGTTIESTGALRFKGVHLQLAEPITSNGGTISAYAGIGNVGLTGPLTLSGSGPTMVTAVWTGGDTTFSGKITGTQGLTLLAGGLNITGNNNNDFQGAVQINGGGIVLWDANGLGTTSAGTTIASGAFLRLSNPGGMSVAEPLTVAGWLWNQSGNNVLSGPVTLSGSPQVETNTGTTLTITSAVGETGGPANWSKVGAPGTLLLTNAGNNYTGTTAVNTGTLRVDGATTSPTVIQANGTLTGTGTINASVTVNDDGDLRPGSSPGILSMGDLDLDGDLFIELFGDGGAGDANGHDRIDVTGAVNIDSGTATLSVDATGLTLAEAAGMEFVIINNDGTGPGDHTGHFNGLLEGAVVISNVNGIGLDLTITYMGGDGNDVALRVNTSIFELVGGDAVFSDLAGLTNNLTLSLVNGGADLQIHDTTTPVTAGAGATQVDPFTVTIPFANVSGNVQIDTAAGDDSLTVDFSGGDPVPAGGVHYDGGTNVLTNPGDQLVLTGGSATTITHTFVNGSDGSASIDGSTISYTGLEPVTDNMSATHRVFTFTGGGETITVTDGIAADGMTMIDSTLGESVYFTNPTASLTINAGTGNDTVTITSVDAGYDASLTINGGTGDDTIHLNADITFAAGNSLDVNLQDDDASPGVDAINVGAGIDLALSGSGSATLQASRKITLASGSSIVTADGAITLHANQQPTPTAGNFIGINVSNASIGSASGAITLAGRGGNDAAGDQFGVRIQSGGGVGSGTSGTVSVTGTGGAGSGSNNHGVLVTGTNSQITSSGGAVLVEGTGNSNSEAVRLESSGAITSGSNAAITITADSVNILASSGGINSGSGTTTIVPKTAGTLIDLGTETGGSLSLTDNELDLVTAGTVQIGDTSSGTMTVSAAISRSTPTNLDLSSASSIIFNPGSLDTAGGVLNLQASNVQATSSGADVNASLTTFTVGTDLPFVINGTTVDTQYRQLNVIGDIDLTGVDLVITGSYVPVAGDSFMIVNNDGIDPIIGAFNGMPEGHLFPNFLGSGMTAVLTYGGGDGNDAVIRIDVVGPKITGTTPSFATTGAIAAGTASMSIAFDKIVSGAATASNYEFRSQGADGVLGNGDDVILALSASYSGTLATLTFPGLAQGVYRLRVKDTITDLSGNQLDGDDNNIAGGDWRRDFVVTAATAGITFAPPQVLTTGHNRTQSSVVADFDGDGWNDVAVTNTSGPSVTVFRSNGSGGFLAPVNYTVAAFGGGYSGLAAAMMNADSRPDLVVGTGGNVQVLYNNGSGGFLAPVTVATGLGSIWSLATADMNNDGRTDIVAADVTRVVVVLANGVGGFHPPAIYTPTGGGNAYPLVIEDFNHDSHLDVFIPTWTTSRVHLFLGSATGTLSTSIVDFTAPSAPFSATSGDFNNDGFVDAVVVNYSHTGSGYAVDAYLGNAGGTLTRLASTLATSATSGPYSIAAGDFDSDGNLDLVLGSVTSPTVMVARGLGNGTFTLAGTMLAGGSNHWVNAVAVGEFDHDGRDDIVVANNITPGNVSILRNQSQSGVVLLSPGGIRFDIDYELFGAGQLIHDGGAFDGLNRLQVGGADYVAPSAAPVFADGGRTLVTPVQSLMGLNVSREVTVPSAGTQDFARTIDSFHNPTGSPITTTVKVVSNLGSDLATTVFNTSDGDSIPETTDQWIGTDDGDGTGTPAVIHFIHGPDGLKPNDVQVVGDNIFWTYNVIVQPGATLQLASFTVVNDTRAGAEAAVSALVNANNTGFANQAAAFLSPADLMALANFQFHTTELSIVGGDLVVTDISLGGQSDTLTIKSDTTNGRFEISDPNRVLGFSSSIPGAIVSGDLHTITVPFTSVSGNVLVNTFGGNDSLTVDFSLGNFSKTVSYDGGTQSSTPGDSLTLTGGSATTITHTLVNASDGSVNIDGSTIMYTGLEPVTDNMSAVNRVFSFTSAMAETITLDASGTLDNRIDSTQGELVDFTNPTGSLTINVQVGGGSGADTINVQGLDAGFNADLSINGGSDDTVNFQTAATDIGTGALIVTGNSIVLSQNVSAEGASLTAQNPIDLTGTSTLDGGAGTVSILANQDGVGAAGFTQASASAIVTTNETLAAVLIDVGGIGPAALAAVTAGTTTGRVAVNAGGTVTDSNGGATNITADDAVLMAGIGIASLVARLQLNVDTVTANSATGDIGLEEVSGDLTVLNVANAMGGSVRVEAATGNLHVGTVSAQFNVVLHAPTGSVTDTNGPGVNNVSSTTVEALSSTGIDLDIMAQISGGGFDATGTGDILVRRPTGTLVISGGGIDTMNGDISATALNGGVVFNTAINAGGTSTVTLDATGDVTMLAGATVTSGGGVDVMAGGNIAVRDITAGGNTAGGGTAAIKLDTTLGDVTVNGPLTATSAGGLNIDIDPVDVFINANQTATGDIDIVADNDVTVAAGVTIEADSDNMGGMAGGTLTIIADLDDDVDDGTGGTLLANAGSNLLGAIVELSGDVVIVDDVTGKVDDVIITADVDATLTGAASAANLLRITALLGDALIAATASAVAMGSIELDAADGTVTVAGPLVAGVNVEIQGNFSEQGSVFIDANITADGNVEVFADETNADVLIGSAAIITSDADMSGGGSVLITADRDVIQNSGSLVSNTGGIRILTYFRDVSIVSAVSNGIDQFAPIAVANASGSAAIQIWPTGDATVTGVVATAGDVEVVSDFGDVNLGGISAGANRVFIQALSGAIIDTNAAAINVTAGALSLDAAFGIGDGNAIETDLGTLSAFNSAAGNIEVADIGANANPLVIGTVVDQVPGVTNLSGGDVIISNASPLVVTDNVSSVGDVTLTAADSAAAGDDLTVNPAVSVTSTGGNIILNAGDNADINGDLLATSGTITINVDPSLGDPDAVGGTIDIDSASIVTTSGGAFLNGGDDNDTFNFAPRTTTSFAVDGNPPVFGDPGVPPGDTLNLDLTALVNPAVLTLGPTPGSGNFSFIPPDLQQSVSFTSIETVNSGGTPFHLVLDMRLAGFEGGDPTDLIEAELDGTGTNLLLIVNGSQHYEGAAADILSLTVIGSSDNDTLQINETMGGLPQFSGQAPVVNNTGIGGGTSNGGHLNASMEFQLDNDFSPTDFSAADVSIHFDGSTGDNGMVIDFSTMHAAAYFSDTVDTANSGNIASAAFAAPSAPDLLLSFANLAPINFIGAGGGLLVDATSTPLTDELTIDDDGSPGDGVSIITGNNGFEDTSFSGFSQLVVRGGGRPGIVIAPLGGETLDLVALDSATTLTSVVLDGDNTTDNDDSWDTLRVRSTPPNVDVTLLGGLGWDNFLIHSGTFFGTGGNTVDGIQGTVNVSPTSGLFVDNATMADIDTLLIDDQADASGDTVNINASTIDGLFDAGTGVDITYNADNLNFVVLQTSAGNDILNLNFMNAAVTDLQIFTAIGFDGDDTFNILNSTPPAAVTNLLGAADRDHFVFSNGALLTGTIDGGSQDDLIDWSAVSGPISVALNGLGPIDGYRGDELSTIDSGVAPDGFTNIDAVLGSASDDDTLEMAANLRTHWDIGGTVSGFGPFGAGGATLTDSLADTGVLIADEADLSLTGNALFHGRPEGWANNPQSNPIAPNAAGEADLAWAGFENLVGAEDADDRFDLRDGASISGTIDGRGHDVNGDSLDYRDWTSPVMVNLGSPDQSFRTATNVGNIQPGAMGDPGNSIENVFGGNSRDVITGDQDDNILGDGHGSDSLDGGWFETGVASPEAPAPEDDISGNDTFLLEPGHLEDGTGGSSDVITDLNGNDTVDFRFADARMMIDMDLL